MDWIDTKSASRTAKPATKNKKTARRANLVKQVQAALAQPTSVWTSGFEHAIAAIKWPKGCDLDSTWLWSTLIAEQAEVLVRSGVSSRLLADLMASDPADSSEPQKLAAVSGLMHDTLEQKAGQWLVEADAYPHAALGVIATVWNLPDLARRDDAHVLSQWLGATTQRCLEHQSEPSECLLGNLVFHCELPLLLGLLTATTRSAAQSSASRAMDDLAEYLENSEDHLGSWLAHGATYLRAALAVVFRCRVLADQLGLRRWYPPQRKSLAKLLEHAARWARRDGSQMLGRSLPIDQIQPLWKAVCQQAGAGRSLRAAMTLSGLQRGDRKSIKKSDELVLPQQSHYDDEAYCVNMQYSWFQRGARVAADFSEATPLIEAIGPKGQSILHGPWIVEVARDGENQLQVDGWHQQCWYSDEDVDYIEMEASFGPLARVQRQLILFRQRRLVLTADALLCEQKGNWTLTSRLPMANKVTWQTKGKNTEGLLGCGTSQCLVLPLYLPEWQSALSSGSLKADSAHLVVQNSCSNGRAIYSPLAISLCNRAASKSYTWRQLTVADDLRIVRRDEAAGYRIQLGKQQLLLYRNLSETRRRTLLGVHALCDFYAASFDTSSGQPETLVEIEQKH